MQQPPNYATSRRVGCLTWLVAVTLVLAIIGLFLDITQEMAWNRRMDELNAIAERLAVAPIAEVQATEVPPIETPTSQVVAVSVGAPPEESTATPTSLPTSTPAPTPTPLPTWTPVPVRVAPKDARDSLFVHGNASPALPEGEQSIVTVVAVGPIQTSEFANWSQIPVVVRNNTGTYVTRIGVTATARDAGGAIVASGGADMLTPNLVQPGEIAFGYIYFSEVKLPPDTRFDFQADYSPAGDSIEQFDSTRDLEVTEVSRVENRLVGLLRSQYDVSLEGPMSIEAVCFNGGGQLQAYFDGYSDQETINPGATASFQIELDEGVDCTNFLVTGSAFVR